MILEAWDKADKLLTFQHFQQALFNKYNMLIIKAIRTYEIVLNNALIWQNAGLYLPLGNTKQHGKKYTKRSRIH